MDDERPARDEPGPERRAEDLGPPEGQPERRSGTLELVERAAAIAAQRVGRTHRMRLVRWTFLASVITSLLIMTPVVLVTSAARNRASVERSEFNCLLWTQGAGVVRDLVRSNAKRRRADGDLLAKYPEITLEYQRIFGPKLVRTFFAEQGGLDARQELYFTTKLLPRIQALADVNCDRAITARGVSETETIPEPDTLTVPLLPTLRPK